MILRAFSKLLGIELSLRHRYRPRLVWLLVAAILVATPLVAQTPGTWEPGATMAQGRAGHTATLLSNGKVLIAGGKDASGHALSAAELYDSVQGRYTPVMAPLPTPVWGQTATLLNDGTVLLVGGNGDSGQPVSAVQLFDPSTSTFTALTPMSTPRSQHTATLLGDGWVFIAGGTNGVRALAKSELYYPGIGPFPAPNPLLTPRQAHTATLLPDGRVLVVGGSNASGVLNSAELHDPNKDDTIVPAGALSFARTQASAALLLDGTVLVAGGQDSQHKELYSAEVYDPRTNAFTLLTALMTTARSGHVGLTLLHNGKVLIAGGTSAGKPVATTEVYDPVLGQFWEVESLNIARQLFGTNFFAIPYTGVLLASGGLDHRQKPLVSSELFFFPTLRSDKPDYSPEEIVTLLGKGWGPHETVTITIHESSGDPDTILTATADSSGTFTNTQFQISPGTSDLGVRFLATAVGQQSKWTAQTVFTDGNVKVSATLAGVTFTLTSTLYQNNTTCNTSGTPGTAGTPATFNNVSTKTFGVGNTDSIKLGPAATSDQNQPFDGWITSSNPFNCLTTPFNCLTAPRTICVPGFSGQGTREYKVNYGGAPVANPQSVTTNEDTAKAITLSASDSNSPSLTFSIVSGPSHGSLTGTPPNVTYTPVANYNGPDSFTFKANDGTLDSNTATVSITVTAVNDAPTATAQSVTTDEDTAKAITLSATDIDSTSLSFSIVTGPSHGSLSATSGSMTCTTVANGTGTPGATCTASVTYTPAANYNGADSFTFKANDGLSDSNIATVSITVTPVNDAPTLTSPGDKAGNEGALLSFTLSATDPDTGQTLTYSAINLPPGATFDPLTQTFAWTPTSAQGGPNPYFVEFQVSDGQSVDVKGISITVNDTIADRDGDGIPDAVDNCPDVPNPNQNDVCNPNSPQGTGNLSLGNATNDFTVDVTFTAGTNDTFFVQLGPQLAPQAPTAQLSLTHIMCKVIDTVTGVEIEPEGTPEFAPLSFFRDGRQVNSGQSLNASITFNLKELGYTNPNLPPRFTVTCGYINFAQPPEPQPGDVKVLTGTVTLPPQTVFLGTYDFTLLEPLVSQKVVNQVPVKFTLKSAGAVVSTCTCKLFVQQLASDGITLTGSPMPAISAGGEVGNVAQFDPTNNQYIFHLSTGNLANGPWQVQIRPDDFSLHTVPINVQH